MHMDDLSVQKSIATIAPTLKRDFVHMELKNNLIAAERKSALNSYPPSSFKRVAIVAMGEPSEEIKQKAQQVALAEKVRQAKREKERAAREAASKKRKAPERK